MNNDIKNFEYTELTYKVIGLCMEVHKILGKGLLEVIYKDALELELKTNKIFFEREKKYNIIYKDIILPHQFNADFVVENSIILELKSCGKIIDEHIKQTLNYMGISKCKIGLLVNFGEASLNYKRLAL